MGVVVTMTVTVICAMGVAVSMAVTGVVPMLVLVSRRMRMLHFGFRIGA
jgi:hypothetical protein